MTFAPPVAPIISGDDVLTFAGVTQPTPADTEWADLIAAGVSDGIYEYLDWSGPMPSEGVRLDQDLLDAPDANLDGQGSWDQRPEIQMAARLAASEAWRRRDAPFGSTGYLDPTSGALIRLARDYLEGVKPVLFRYRNMAGLIA